MKRFTRSIAVLAFLLANLALMAMPADAGRRSATCIDGDGEQVLCCRLCFLFCEGCALPDDGDGDDNDDNDDSENN